MNNYEIIILGLSRWDGKYSSASLSLAKEFARNNRVFFVDHPFTLKDVIWLFPKKAILSRLPALLFGKNKYKKLQGVPDNFTAVTPPMTLPINFLPEGRLYEFLAKINKKIFLSCLRGIIRDYEVKEYIFINSFDPYYVPEFPSDIKPRLKIYQTIDDISQEKYVARHGVRLEDEVIADSDLTLATSRELTRLKSKIIEKVFYLPNAVDISLFKKAWREKLPKPKELPAKDSKIILYTGHIDFRINYRLLRKIALENPDKYLLLVGPVSSRAQIARELFEMENVIFTGPKNINELPEYLQYSHCTIIPFICNTLTRSIYPLKINEYLGAGKPVVSTDFSEDIKSFNNVIHIAQDEESFVGAIKNALDEDSEEKARQRISVAESNTWEGRVNNFWSIIDEVTQKEMVTK